MIRHRNSLAFTCVLILMTLSLMSCTSGGTNGANTGGTATGTLALSLMDNPSPYQAIYVTINEVRVHHDVDGWETLSNLDLNLPQTINLLQLVNGTMAYLGSTELAAGHYSQMRLILEDNEQTPQTADLNILGNPHPYFNYLIDPDDEEIPLKIPSGGNTGIKLVKGFDIKAERATELVLDFDALKSVVQAGKSGKWILKPTIKVVETVTNSVAGKVIDAAEGQGLEGAMVSAQKNDGAPEFSSEVDQVTVEAGTESDAQGDYFISLPLLAPAEDPYRIVATKAGYETACQQLPSNETMAYTADFGLTALTGEEIGILFVSVKGLTNESDSALFSIRQIHSDCGVIEVGSRSVANTTDEQNPIYSSAITLPAGVYQIVISAEGQVTQFDPLVDIIGGQELKYDAAFE